MTFRFAPSSSNIVAAATSDSGMANADMNAARALNRNAARTAMAKTDPAARCSAMPSTERWM